MMNGLSLCAGIGGLDLALRAVVESYQTIAYVEIEPFCQEILCRRMDDGRLDRAPIWPDLRTFDGQAWRGLVDIVSAGFPCQPFSVAGRRRGADDARNLWPDIRRVIAESEPSVVFLENVPGAMPYVYHVVLPELSGLGYTAQAGLFTAAEVGAPHKRQRVFILAGANNAALADARPVWKQERETRSDRNGGTSRWSQGAGGTPQSSKEMGNASTGRDERPRWPPGPDERDRWADITARWPELAPAESIVRRMAHGLSTRVDRLKALGNAVVPTQAALAFRGLRSITCVLLEHS